ncbi:MAG: OmpA family protein [Myxococcota bacterium]
MIAAIALLTAARAQVVPPVAAEPYRPSLDNPRLSWVDTADRPNPGPSFAVGARYTRDALLYARLDGLASPVLHDAALADLSFGYGVGPVRFGAVAPVLVRASGWGGGETGLGDVAAAVRATALDTAHVDLAVDGRLWLPTTSVAAPIGHRGVAGEVAGVVSATFGPVLLAVNSGYRALPVADLDGVRIDDVVTGRMAFGVGTDRVGGALEAAAQAVTSRPDGASLPVELLLGGWYRTAGPLGVRAGVGRGVTAAVGAPSLRAVAALTYTSRPKTSDDADRDGLRDADDACPREPEDVDGWRDTDGCPDRPVLSVEIVDESGAPVDAQGAVVSPQQEVPFARSAQLELDPGSYTVVAHAPGFADAMTALTVTEGPPRTLRLTMSRLRVVVTHDRFDLHGEIFFASGSDEILPASHGLLDEVAQALQSTPQIRLLRIEGHTDRVGLPRENLLLSQRRAESVRRYLVGRGVDAARLVSVGLGERHPLVETPDEMENAENRRVEFIVERWEEGR